MGGEPQLVLRSEFGPPFEYRSYLSSFSAVLVNYNRRIKFLFPYRIINNNIGTYIVNHLFLVDTCVYRATLNYEQRRYTHEKL